jgi:hypothetical protein
MLITRYPILCQLPPEYVQLKPVLTKDEFNQDWYLGSEGLVQNREFLNEPPEEEKNMEQQLYEQIKSPIIAIKKYSDVTKISNNKVDGKLRDKDFEYYRVDSGMNINVPSGRVTEMRFVLSFFADNKQSRNAIPIDGFPNNKIKNIQILNGKVALSINKMLEIIPHPISQTLANVLTIDIEPWNISWNYPKLEVTFSGALTDKLVWNLFEDNINQSFDCYVTLQKKKNVRTVTAKAYAAWKYQPHGKIEGWFKNRFGRSYAPVRTDEQEIVIIDSKNR